MTCQTSPLSLWLQTIYQHSLCVESPVDCLQQPCFNHNAREPLHPKTACSTPILALAAQLWYPLHAVSQNTLAYTNFSFTYPAGASSVQRAPGHPSSYLIHLQLSCQGALFTESPWTLQFAPTSALWPRVHCAESSRIALGSCPSLAIPPGWSPSPGHNSHSLSQPTHQSHQTYSLHRGNHVQDHSF